MYTLCDGELKLENLATHRPAAMNGTECSSANLLRENHREIFPQADIGRATGEVIYCYS